MKVLIVAIGLGLLVLVAMDRLYREKTCPFCRAKIPKEAVKCKHCGSEMVAGPVNPSAKESEKGTCQPIGSRGSGLGNLDGQALDRWNFRQGQEGGQGETI